MLYAYLVDSENLMTQGRREKFSMSLMKCGNHLSLGLEGWPNLEAKMIHPPIHIITKAVLLSVGPKCREVGSLVAYASRNFPLILLLVL